MLVVCLVGDKDLNHAAEIIENQATNYNVTILNTLRLPDNLSSCSYLPIELAMLEASDILFMLGSTSNRTECLRRYAMNQNIPIIYSWAELSNAAEYYPNVTQ